MYFSFFNVPLSLKFQLAPFCLILKRQQPSSTVFLFIFQTDRGTEFRRSHHMVRKTTLYDMDVDPTCKYAAVGCQDRCIRWVCGHVCVCIWRSMRSDLWRFAFFVFLNFGGFFPFWLQDFQHQQWQTEETLQGITERGWQSAQGNIFLHCPHSKCHSLPIFTAYLSTIKLFCPLSWQVRLDPSGQYVATSCSDKNISIFDFYTGECVATMFGHSGNRTHTYASHTHILCQTELWVNYTFMAVREQLAGSTK